MRDPLNTKRTRRYVIGTVLTGRLVRTAADVATVAAQVAAGSLTAIDGASFGLFDSAVADDSCSITAGAAVLTSPNNPWTSADVGKAIDVQGAGVAGATLRSRVKAYTNAGSVTLWDNASTTVAALVNSAGGLAIWGNDFNLARTLPATLNEAGTAESTKAAQTVLATGSLTARSIADRLADTFNAKDFGCVGDGVTDNYAAFVRLSAVVNAAGGGTVLFPPGTYFVAGYRTLANGLLTPLIFSGCNGLALIGYGAKIDIFGAFNRALATDEQWLGIQIKDCARVSVEGFEIDGNNQDMTKGAVNEGTGYGIGLQLLSCDDVSLANLYVHHFQSDGVNIRDSGTTTGPRLCCKRVTAINVKSQYNGRQGLTVTQLRGGTFIDCEFSYTSRSAYGGHSPQSGVDVEPNRSTATTPPDQMDFNTGDLVFIGCRMVENEGAQFTASTHATADTILVQGCRIEVGGGGAGGTDAFIVDVPRATVRGCYIDVGTKIAYFGLVANTDSSFFIQNNEMRCNGLGTCLRALFDMPMVIEGNRFIGYYTAPTTVKMFRVTNLKAVVRNNYQWVPAAAYVDGGTGDRHVINDNSCRISANNVFETDLTAGVGSSGTAHYANAYLATTPVDCDVFIGTAPGTADTFRPYLNAAVSNLAPYKQNGERLYASATYDPPSLADGVGTTTTIAVTGAEMGDWAMASFSRDLQGITVTAYVSVAGTVSVRFQNESGGVLDLASGTLRVLVLKGTLT